MSLPSRISLINSLLKALQKKGGRSSRAEIFDLIAKELVLSDEVRYQANQDGIYIFEKDLIMARQYLLSENYFDSSLPGLWVLTAKGLESDLFSEDGLKRIQKKMDFKDKEDVKADSSDEEKPEDPGTSKVGEKSKPKRTWSRKKKVVNKKAAKKTGTKRKYIRKVPSGHGKKVKSTFPK